MTGPRNFRSVVVGCSMGGLDALKRLLGPLPADFSLQVVVVSHLAPGSGSMLAELLGRSCRLPVVEVQDKMAVALGRVHVCPGDYHLLVEEDETFSLSVDAKVCHVRPSVDVLFKTAAAVWRDGLIGIVLTGANSDGTAGLLAIRANGGYCLVEDPQRAHAAFGRGGRRRRWCDGRGRAVRLPGEAGKK